MHLLRRFLDRREAASIAKMPRSRFDDELEQMLGAVCPNPACDGAEVKYAGIAPSRTQIRYLCMKCRSFFLVDPPTGVDLRA